MQGLDQTALLLPHPHFPCGPSVAGHAHSCGLTPHWVPPSCRPQGSAHPKPHPLRDPSTFCSHPTPATLQSECSVFKSSRPSHKPRAPILTHLHMLHRQKRHRKVSYLHLNINHSILGYQFTSRHDSFKESCRTLLGEIKQNENKQRAHSLQARRLEVPKATIFFEFLQKFNVLPSKAPKEYFIRT